ncbi:MAG: hypothetical protein AAB462_03390 [Patescibacteria group bacterium]
MAYRETKQYETPSGGYRTPKSIEGLFKMAEMNVAEVDLAALSSKPPEQVIADSLRFRAQRQHSVEQASAHSPDRRI